MPEPWLLQGEWSRTAPRRIAFIKSGKEPQMNGTGRQSLVVPVLFSLLTVAMVV